MAQITESAPQSASETAKPNVVNLFPWIFPGSDVNDQFCSPNSVFTQGNNHYISINIEHDEMEARRLFNQLSVRGHIEMQLEKTFWGALYGAFTDQFGIKWMVNCQLEE